MFMYVERRGGVGGAKGSVMMIRRMLTTAALAVMPFGAPAWGAESCAGDCDGDGTVAINELVRAVTIALGSTAVAECTVADANGDGSVTIAELIGAVNTALGGCVDGEVTRTPVPTATPVRTPTGPVVPGCDNGTFDVSYSHVSGGGNVVTSDLTLDLVAAGQVRNPANNLYFWSIVGLQCTGNTPTFHRAVQIQFLPAQSGFAPGTYTLTPPLSSFIYPELQDDNVYLRAWDTTSATLVIESVDGDDMTFRISASMKPQPLLSFGQTPTGTFDLEVTGTVERFTSQ
jgi:hypothetical protein